MIVWFRIPAFDAPEVGRRRLLPGPRGGKVCPRCIKGSCPLHWLPAAPGYVGGYYSTSRQALHADPRAVRYHDWQEHVSKAALPFLLGMNRATKEDPFRLAVWGWFRDGAHCDPSNLTKAICDVLFPPSAGGDKHVYTLDGLARVDAEHPEVWVAVGLLEEFGSWSLERLEINVCNRHDDSAGKREE